MKIKYTTVIIILIIFIGSFAWRKTSPPVKSENQAVPNPTEQPAVVEASGAATSTTTTTVASTNGPLIPIPGNWVLMGADKVRMLTNRETQLQMLDGFGGAILGNRRIDPAGVAAMFDTLIQLVGDSDEEVGVMAAFELYALGDYNGVALTRLRLSLKESAKSVELKYAEYYQVLLRTGKILNVLEAAKDHRLDDVIYEAWQSQKEREFQLPSRMEYAEYLEKAGKQLPEEYWARWGERGLQFARELLRDRYGKKYQPLFKKQAEQGDSWATGVLYEQTQDRSYLTSLTRQADEHVDSLLHMHGGRDERSLGELCRVAPEVGRPIVERLLAGGGSCAKIGSKAITTDQSAEAAETLYLGALKQWTGKPIDGRRFPRFQLQALAERKSAVAQERYEQLKREILGKPRPKTDNEGPVYKESDFYPSDILRPATPQ